MTDAGDWLRRAGHGRLADGSLVTWSIAAGRRGRRWREVVVRDAAVVSSLLFETAPDDHFSHLELSTATGLLTLHPEGDGTLHGNSIGVDGVRHVVGLPWERDAIVLLEGSVVSRAAATRLLSRSIEPGESGTEAGLAIGLDLVLDRRDVAIGRSREGAWGFDGEELLTVDPNGTPVLRDRAEWPLEA
jgi:hypothetical protein